MKKILAFTAAALAFASVFAQKVTIDVNSAKNSYGKISISPMDKGVTVKNDTITFAPKKEGVTYTISGYFKGQLINKTKNTVLKFDNAYIENTEGLPAIYGDAKIEISTTQGSKNYILSSGNGEKTGAIHCKKNLELGGSGTMNVVGKVRHGIKGDDIKIKGSGTWYVQGAKNGSAINCRSFLSEREKSFKAYFVNSKNGIKADNTISISSGAFFIYDNETGFKTDTKKDDPANPHSIRLAGGVIHTAGNKELYETEQNAFNDKGAKVLQD